MRPLARRLQHGIACWLCLLLLALPARADRPQWGLAVFPFAQQIDLNVVYEVTHSMPQALLQTVQRHGIDVRRVKSPQPSRPVNPLLADNFRLMSGYAAHDANAGMGVKVGVIDTGVGPHDDLVVQGGACLVTGEQSTDFTDNGVGHGTHVAGIIAARRSALSGEGVYGLAPACILTSYRVCPRSDNPTAREQAKSVDVAAAIEKAIVDQCDFVNISLGSTEAMPEVPAVLEKARNAGMVVFALAVLVTLYVVNRRSRGTGEVSP